MKKIILLLSILLLTGCKLTSKIEINEDLSLKETIVVTESTYKLYANIDEEIEHYKEMGIENPAYKGYSFTTNRTSTSTSVTAQKSYSSIQEYCDFLEGKTDLFSYCSIVTNDNEVTIKLITNHDNSIFFESFIDAPLFSSATFNIEVPFKVMYTNADFIKDKTYSWTFNNDNYNKDISITFDMSKNYRTTNNYLIYVLGGIIVGILILGIYTYNVYKKNSKF